MKEYLDACRKILDEGTPIFNERTGTVCHTLANLTFTYDVGNNKFPLITTRKGYYKAAIAELLGYLRGYDNAAQFRSIGCNTWNANANDNKAWLANPNRKGEDDMGRVYGVQGREWLKPDGTTHDQLQKLVNNLTAGIDDRGEILTFYNPGEFELGCLRPCMHTHQFTLLDDTLHLTSFQRSCDAALGQVFNSVQCFVLLALIAQITGHKAGLATHHIVNAHIYDNQVEGVRQLLEREPYESPSLVINENIKTLADIESWVSTDDFTVVNYKHHDPITIPFSV